MICGPGKSGSVPEGHRGFRKKEVKASHKAINVADNTEKGFNTWFCLLDG